MPNLSTIIRPSTLGSWSDCARRTVAQSFQADVAKAGFETKRLQPGAGAGVGKAVHKAVESMLKRKKATGEVGAAPVADAIDGFMEEIKGGCEWDATTGNKDTAVKQITELTNLYATAVLPGIEPKIVEERFYAEAGDGFALSGQIDLQDTADVVHDLKTGSKTSAYWAQLGSYALLLEANKHRVSGLQIDFLKRVGVTKSVEPPVVESYDVQASKEFAVSVIRQVKRDLTAFRESGDPSVIPANPSSFLCSAKYCSVFGTSFCKLGREKAA